MRPMSWVLFAMAAGHADHDHFPTGNAASGGASGNNNGGAGVLNSVGTLQEEFYLQKWLCDAGVGHQLGNTDMLDGTLLNFVTQSGLLA